MSQLVTISTRPEDLVFGQDLAAKLDLPFVAITDFLQLATSRVPLSKCFILWDIDDQKTTDMSHPIAIEKVHLCLKPLRDHSRIFGIADSYTNLFQTNLGSQAGFLINHHVMRRDLANLIKVLPRLFYLIDSPSIDGLSTFFNADTKIHSVQLKKSEHKQPASAATESFLKKSGCEARIAERVSQATDEFLMNAIFDAARDREGKAFRNLLNRDHKFDLRPFEYVDLEMAISDELIGICVKDRHGSLTEEYLQRYLGQNYQNTDYKIKKFGGPGAGLGLYGIIQSGLSIVMAVQKKKMTCAMLFVPKVKNFKAFKGSFQFIGNTFFE